MGWCLIRPEFSAKLPSPVSAPVEKDKDKIKYEDRISRTPFFKKVMWRIEYAGHWAIESVVGRLPTTWSYYLGERLAGFIWHLMPRRRSTVINNLRIVLSKNHTVESIEALAEESFRRSGGNLLAAARTARMKPDQLGEVLKVENPELMEEAIAEGKGVVLILAHMGNWELMSRLPHFCPEGTSVGGVYRMLNNPLMDAKVLKRREADGSQMFSKRDQFYKMAEFIRDGGVLGVLADQRTGRSGELTHYFGRMTRVSPIPKLLARRTGCRVVALSMMSDGPGYWRNRYIEVEKPYTTANCTKALEEAILASPLDVFWLQQRWKTYVRTGGFSFQNWLNKVQERSTKPHRVLLWLPDVPQDWKLADDWIHADVDYELAMPAGRLIHRKRCSNRNRLISGFRARSCPNSAISIKNESSFCCSGASLSRPVACRPASPGGPGSG